MLYIKTDSGKYISEFKERFSNFAQKAPILLSFIVSDSVVNVIHENSGQSYSFEWDFTTPVKSFIHEIKQVLSDNHYPRLDKVTVLKEPLTSEEYAEMISEGTSVDNLPSFRETRIIETFRIDKVIALKDRFILQSESTYKLFLYKLNYSSIFFLKNYRSGKYKSLEEAGDFFFGKAELVEELTSKD